MPKYYFIGVPTETTRQETLKLCSSKLNDLAAVSSFEIPQFKVGTLDILVSVSDELSKVDIVAESIVLKVVENLKTLTESKEHAPTDLMTQSLMVAGRPVNVFVKSFAWNSVKYRVDKPIPELVTTLTQELTMTDQLVKNKMTIFNTAKSSLVAHQRKQTGSLAVKCLDRVVKKDNFIQDSEYMQTQLVAVLRADFNHFLANYETLTQMVVPRSATYVRMLLICRKIAEDEEYGLFAVVVFCRVRDDFVSKCKESKWIPRDYKYDEQAIISEQQEASQLGNSVKEQQTSMLRLCRANFGEIFAAWIHIKALRIFVESILRYGLPPNFQAMVLLPSSKNIGKIRTQLHQLYGKLGSSHGKEEPVDDIQGIVMEKEYFPYANFELSWDHN